MNPKHYQAYKEYEGKGLRKQASESLRAFISSFQNENEVSEWVWEYLPRLESNRHARIRHELFHELVYPVLKSGYESNDFEATLWLAKLAQNVYQSQKVHEELSWVRQLELFEKCHEIEPENDEARLLFLNSIVSWLEYTEHEWPAGILYGNDGATIEQCSEINKEIQRVLRLDKEHKHSAFIKQYSKKLSEYKARLNK
jgi:hypothetical protein